MFRGITTIVFGVMGAALVSAQEAPAWRKALAELEAKLQRLESEVREQRAEIERLRPGRTANPDNSYPQAAAPLVQTEPVNRSLAGFRFSGDFRYRLDVQRRTANEIAGPLQSIRSRYRMRLNVDKEIDRRFSFHAQLSTGPLHNGLTNDLDMGATVAKHLFTIAEAWVDYHPTRRFSMRGGRMDEVFADNMRFLWDEDVRFNGFEQTARASLGRGFAGFQELEVRAGEYFLSNPEVPVLAAGSPYVAAGHTPGKNVRDAMLFHPGFVLRGEWRGQWRHHFIGDMQLYSRPHQIQLASTAAGVPLVVNNTIGAALPGPMTGAGNATMAPGGARYAARHFQIARLAYRIGHTSRRAWLDFQVSRNVGTGSLRDAMMLSANFGEIREAGNTRFLYQFAIKDANSMISQFTDDELGTTSGVNLAVHALRFDVGLARYMQWQNLFFLQNARRASNPAAQFFVPLQRGAEPTFRYLSQLAFSF